MRTSNNSPNSVDAYFAATFVSVTALVDKTAATEPIEEGEKVELLYYNGGATGGGNKAVDEVMFNVVLASSHKIYNSVNKVILRYCFGDDNNQRGTIT